MAADKFAFKSRMSNVDWALLHTAVLNENPDLYQYRRAEQQDSAWLVYQITQFCKNIATPILRHHPPPPLGPAKLNIEKVVMIPERHIGSSTNLMILEDFAAYKGKPLTQIIQRYIIDPKIFEQEMRTVAKMRL
jgi:hypothetical protein